MLEALLKIQAIGDGTPEEPRRWSDAKMAAQLGVHRSTWNLIRRNKYPVSPDRFYRRAIAAFPALQKLYIVHVINSIEEVA